MKADAPNIILITIDCLRFDHLGCYGYNRDITPNIDNLASKGALFLQAISNGGQTPFAFPSILASASPPLEKTEDREIMRRSITLAHLLKEAGYHTAGFHSNLNLLHAFNYSKGFDIFEDNLRKITPIQRLRNRLDRRLNQLWALTFGTSVVNFLARVWKLYATVEFLVGGPPSITADELTDQAIEWGGAHKGKIFLWLHYMDAHMPYMPLPQYLGQLRARPVSRRKMVSLFYKAHDRPNQLSPSEVATLIDLYDAQIKYVDDAVRRLLDSLGSELANTIVAITADHGDEFGEHGKFTHQTLYEGIIHVPLIIAGPGIRGGTTVKQLVSLLDLPPTLTNLVGINNVPSFHGKSLLPAMRGEEEAAKSIISTFIGGKERMIAYRIPGWKYIQTESHIVGETELGEEVYDLTNDPGETRNLHGMSNEQAKNFELEAKNRLSQYKKLKIEEKTAYEKQKIRVKIKRLRKP